MDDILILGPRKADVKKAMLMLIRFFRCSILKLLDKEVTDLLVCANPKR